MQRYIIQLTLILTAILFAGLPMRSANNNNKQFIVVIDAGHGGKDIGATDNGVMEKNINLKVAKKLESLVKKKMKDTKVVMTRDDDSFLSLQERADKANKAKGDLFISIHTNSVDKKNKNRENIAGSSVYTLGLHKDENNLQVAMRENSVIELEKNYEQKYSGFDPQKDESYIIFEMAQKKNLTQSIKFAESVKNELVGIGREDRGVHQAGFWVLWSTSMPAVLVELDFICNPESAKYLSSDQGAQEMAEAIYNAVERYGSGLKGSSLAIMPSEKIDPQEEVATTKKRTQSTQAQRKSKKEKEKSGKNVKKENAGQSPAVIESEPINESEIAVATSRKEARHHIASNNKNSNRNSGQARRKRRSANSRQLSLTSNYETGSITVGGISKGVETLRTSKDEDQKLASNSEKKNSKKKEKKKAPKEKPKKVKKEKKERVSSHNAKVTKMVTVYKIQVLASEDYLSQNSSRFCGLSPITSYKENNLYKYYYGESTDRGEMESMLDYVREKIPDAFIVSSKKSVQ